MGRDIKLFAIDDDPVVRDVIGIILESDYPITTFESVEACRPVLAGERPDLLLLDVNLPGMDGFAFCRELKADPALRTIPVIFISSRESIEERICGYDAGGMDYIVKPFEPEELARKVRVAENMVLGQRSLAVRAEEAELLSSLVMASMDETGIVLQFMSKLIAMDSDEEIAAGLLEVLARYRLEGVVQTRTGREAQTFSAAGRNLPLEVSVIEHVRSQGRIFEFRRRSVHNFERVTLMINNLPLEDPDYCGRLRDHLSVAAQGADSRLKAVATEAANRRVQEGILSALDSITGTITELRAAQQANTEASAKLIAELQDTLLNSFYRLGLTDHQERFLQNMIGDFTTQMVALLNRSSEAQETLQRLNLKLAQLRTL